ncbi:putative actin-binding protein frabin-beta [Paratrimastix pyriformis]|uniref:Actin-binding protein frabin-beta n=1 Tax=Paratrimastix pyriformis TaxID=342808 RepID=A0ABQ8U7R5_9EUKA|nr:putative actin-binding protein frabin-beta [Paratrimastix pyriformis]
MSEQAATRIQSKWRGLQTRMKFKKMLKQHRHRTSVAKEILETERTYVTQINQLVDLFMVPINTAASVGQFGLTPEQGAQLFSGIQTVLMINTELLGRLEERLANWGPYQKLGDIFIGLAAYLKMYSDYASNYDSASSFIRKKLMKDPIFEEFLQIQYAQPGVTLDLESYLILPIQRIPRYNLLLQDMLAHTWPDHPDYGPLQEALEKMRETALHVDSYLRTVEVLNKVHAIQESLMGKFENLCVPARVFIREGAISKVSPHNVRRRTLFLFNDLLVYASPIPLVGRCIYKGRMDLATGWLQPVPDQADQGLFPFLLVTPTRTFLFDAGSAADKADWIGAIQQQIDQNTKRDPTLIERRGKIVLDPTSKLWTRYLATLVCPPAPRTCTYTQIHTQVLSQIVDPLPGHTRLPPCPLPLPHTGTHTQILS